MLFLFFGSLCILPLHGQSPRRAKQPAPQPQNQMLLKALDLSEEQQESLKSLREAQRELQNQFREKARELRTEMEALGEDPVKNSDRIENLQDDLFNLRIEQMKSQHAHSKEIRKVFTTEQLEKLNLLRRFQMRRRQGMNRGIGRLRGPRGNFPGPMRGRNMRSPIRRWRR